MTEKVNPSINRPATAFKTAGAIALGGGSDPGYVVPASNTTELSIQDANISDSNLSAFTETHSGTSYDVTIDPGEAFVFGSWVVTDASTTVTLSGSTANQRVFVGWNKDGSDDLIIGTPSAFASASGDTDKKIPLWEFDTDGSGVTASRDVRELGQTINALDEATAVSSNYTTDGEQVIYADTSSSAVTITLASADVFSGKSITVVDQAGNASTNTLSIDTEGTETINGSSLYEIKNDYGSISLGSDGLNWLTAGGGGGGSLTNNAIEMAQSGVVGASEAASLVQTSVRDTEKLEIFRGTFVMSDGTPVPSGCDLVIATLDGSGGATKQASVLSGDGSTTYTKETGDPLASYSNTSGSTEHVAVFIDNGHFNSGTGTSQDVQAGVRGNDAR